MKAASAVEVAAAATAAVAVVVAGTASFAAWKVAEEAMVAQALTAAEVETGLV